MICELVKRNLGHFAEDRGREKQGIIPRHSVKPIYLTKEIQEFSRKGEMMPASPSDYAFHLFPPWCNSSSPYLKQNFLLFLTLWFHNELFMPFGSMFTVLSFLMEGNPGYLCKAAQIETLGC